VIDPQAVFDRLVGSRRVTPVDPAAQARRATGKSVLDFVMSNAASLGPNLGRSDSQRLDQFMTSVRNVEKRIDALTTPAVGPGACVAVPNRPALHIDLSVGTSTRTS
jgi:hypothetical protein